FGVYPSCEGGDGYRLPEAKASCQQWESAPRAADLLLQYVTDSLGGRVRAPAAGRISRTGSTNPG
ncbi:MAG: hypothetical protein ACR2HK_14315, partial [Gemmatimonadales bacterium]